MRLEFNMKARVFGLLGLVVLVYFVGRVYAYDLTLTAVGVLSTLGVDYSLVNYTGGVPALTGTASPSAEVAIKIKTLLKYSTASTSGIWQFVPTSLDQGDNLIVISSGTQSISFTLRFNATSSGDIATPAALPDESALLDAGVWGYYVPALAAGLGVYILGRFGKRKMQKWEKGNE
jgi:hypothetical protein